MSAREPLDPATRLVTVCARCLRASCWQGKYYCDGYMTAKTKRLPLRDLHRLALEHPSYWTKACEEGVDFVKTSTGFGPRGASLEDIHAMSEVIRVESKLTKHRIGIKASGGIKTWDQARSFLEAGADRLGTSSAFEITQQFLSRDS